MNRKRKKTAQMRLLEIQYKLPIEELIKNGSVREVGDKLGVSGAVVSLWRMRLGIGK